MKNRLIELIKKLDGIRGEVVSYYLLELESFTSNDGNPKAAVKAGILHDLDRHISNLELEVKRLEGLEKLTGEDANA